jgi:uncharacterized protein (DUF934 family)
MAIVRNGRVIDDPWHALDGRDPTVVDPATPLLLTFAEWIAHHGALDRFARLGVCLVPSDDVRELDDGLGRLDLVTVSFPKFNDGRAFSQARLLREAQGFKGEIRATGHILRDQLNFLRRAGVDAIEVPDGGQADLWAKAWEAEAMRFKGYYQPALDGGPNLPPARPTGALRRWAGPAAVTSLAAGTLAVHGASCAGVWAY